jgi:predicted membrane protein
METQSKINPSAPDNTRSPGRGEYHEPQGRLLGGLVVVLIGGVLLARQLGVHLPYWLFNFEMLVIVIGIFIGAKTNFRDSRWLIPVAIGGLLLVNNHFYDFNITRYFWPIFIIAIGLLMIMKSKKNPGFFSKRWEEKNFSTQTGSEDAIDCVTVFGGIKKNIISKEFKGGEAVTIFGGTELNLMQADAKEKIVLELVQLFGGTKLLVPPHWKIQTEEMVTIFGGLTDKRPMPSSTTPDAESKVIVLKGVCIFGGIDIKSF